MQNCIKQNKILKKSNNIYIYVCVFSKYGTIDAMSRKGFYNLILGQNMVISSKGMRFSLPFGFFF